MPGPMDFADPRTAELLQTALAGLADRINDDVNALGRKARDRQEAERLQRHRDDLNRIIGQVFGRPPAPDGADEDTDDVPGSVRHLAHYLCGLQIGWPPTHPYAGTDGDRVGRGAPGHCWVCAVVGHVVAHPERGCGDVGCGSDHADADSDVSVGPVPAALATGVVLVDLLPPLPPV